MKFAELLDTYHIPYQLGGAHHHVMTGWLGFDCPFCGPGSNHFHMGYHLSKKFVTCWRCGYKPLYEVIRLLTKEPSQICSQLVKGLGRETFLPRARGQLKLPAGLAPLASPHKRYLRGRGLDPLETARVWGLQGIGLAAKLAWRVWIPITQRGQIVSWTTRSISDESERRYITAKPTEEDIPAKEVLFGADLAQATILICEGPFDAIKVGPGAVATLGIGYSRIQLVKILKFPRRYVCFDNEPIAQKRAEKLCNELSIQPGETWNIVLDAKDPGSAGEKELKRLRKLLR